MARKDSEDGRSSNQRRLEICNAKNQHSTAMGTTPITLDLQCEWERSEKQEKSLHIYRRWHENLSPSRANTSESSPSAVPGVGGGVGSRVIEPTDMQPTSIPVIDTWARQTGLRTEPSSIPCAAFAPTGMQL